MKNKRIKSILLLFAIVLSIMPIGFAADETASVPKITVNGANLTPKSITQNDITLSKTAKKTSDTTWNVSLSVTNDGAQALQNGSVTDSIGTHFVYVNDSAHIQQAAAAGVTPPYIAVQNEGAELVWKLGTPLEKGTAAALTYTVTLHDALFEGADIVVPLHQKAVFTGSAEMENGNNEKYTLDFPMPKAIYSAGTLHVFSSGLPQGIHGTTQDIAKTLVTDKAEFEVLPPLAAPTQAYLSGVRVNGSEMSIDAFEAQYAYRMPVVAGETAVEYCYQMKETTPVEWRYNVEYYVNEILKPEWSYSGTVEAANPILTGVDNNLAKMPDYYEMPHVAFPYTLQADGETIQIHYVAIPLPNAELVVNSAYFLNDTTTKDPPSPPISVAPMGILPQTSGGHVYGNTICGIAAAWLSFAPHRKRK